MDGTRASHSRLNTIKICCPCPQSQSRQAQRNNGENKEAGHPVATPRLRVRRTVSYDRCQCRSTSRTNRIFSSFGAAAITIGLPILLHVFNFACNDVSGCPSPSLLRPKSLDLETLKQEVGWPENGVWGLASWEVTGWTFAYYLYCALLYRILPGTEMEGVVLSSGGRLKYKLNSGFPSCREYARLEN